jgi:hypothetical protein
MSLPLLKFPGGDCFKKLTARKIERLKKTRLYIPGTGLFSEVGDEDKVSRGSAEGCEALRFEGGAAPCKKIPEERR